jgi:peptide deformylase
MSCISIFAFVRWITFPLKPNGLKAIEAPQHKEFLASVTALKILKYPHPCLSTPGLPINQFDDALRQLVDDMVESMYACHGAIGLAAPQIGHSVQVFVMDMNAKTTKDKLMVLVNPVLTQQSRNKMVREGCLSFPDYLASVKRATKVTVEAYDQWGNVFQHQAEALEAVCIQHEVDHLNGVLMLDRIESLKTDWLRRRDSTLPNEEENEA